MNYFHNRRVKKTISASLAPIFMMAGSIGGAVAQTIKGNDKNEATIDGLVLSSAEILKHSRGLSCIQNIPDDNLPLRTGFNNASAIRLASAYAFYLEMQKRDPQAVEAILNASEKVGVDFELMLVKAMIESSLGLHDAPLHINGSARGLYQYMPATWLTVFKWYGAAYENGKYKDLADAISFNGYNPVVKDDKVKQQILDLRSDHKVAAFIKAMHLKYDEEPTLRKMLNGDDPTYKDYYVLHLLGEPKAKVFFENLQKNPGYSAANKLSREARYNRGLFYQGSRKLSFQEVYERIEHRLDIRLEQAHNDSKETLQNHKCIPPLLRNPNGEIIPGGPQVIPDTLDENVIDAKDHPGTGIILKEIPEPDPKRILSI